MKCKSCLNEMENEWFLLAEEELAIDITDIKQEAMHVYYCVTPGCKMESLLQVKPVEEKKP